MHFSLGQLFAREKNQVSRLFEPARLICARKTPRVGTSNTDSWLSPHTFAPTTRAYIAFGKLTPTAACHEHAPQAAVQPARG